MHLGKIAHPHFQMLSKPPRAHWKIWKTSHLSNPYYSFAKKNSFERKTKQNNSCPFCNNLLTSTCQTRRNYPPQYKRHQALPSLKVTCVTAGLPYTTTLLLWGPACKAKALPTGLGSVFWTAYLIP